MKSKRKNLYHIFFLNALFILWGCVDQANRNENLNLSENKDTSIKHAVGFSVQYFPGFKFVEVREPYKDAKESAFYLLQSEPGSIPDSLSQIPVIKIPIKEIVCTSTTHIPFLDLLEVTNTLTGFPTGDYISSPVVRKMIENDQVVELGVDNALNIELLLDLSPELVMGYSLTGNMNLFNQIEYAGIPYVLNAEYLEETPLGRAEWIKFVALFFNKEKKADSIFDQIESKYMATLEVAQNTSFKPSVISGTVYGDFWYMPGGNSWAAKYFNDANADFLWKDNSSEGSLQLSFESVYDQAHDVEYWIGVADFRSIKSLISIDPRYSQFEALQNDNLYTYNKRVIETGGNDFFEQGIARPDIVLQDLVKILHPETLPGYELYFYRKLDP
jgi:iron complex transport system substrate-binding protein